MKKIFFLLIALCYAGLVFSQNIFSTIIKDSKTNETLAGASVTISNTTKGTTTNANGFAQIKNISNGSIAIIVSFTGYQKKLQAFTFPLLTNDTTIILLEQENEDLQQVIVQSTRTSRTIANTPTRVETIDGEELDEKNNMRPANVSMLLHESTGLQVQQTSATNGNASIRVQGLDGRYTQLLKDGYPNFGNFASGLSILEIPPLDLKQVEVIKGPASTLYGGGAIAGVVNFISKQPKEKAEYNFIFNQSNVGQTNIGGYASQKKEKLGYSILALANFQKAYDVDGDEFSELPKSNSFTINPRFFFYPNGSTTMMLGNSFSKGSNIGGDMKVINNQADNNHTYFEDNATIRNTTTLELDKKFRDRSSLKIKQSLSFFDRRIALPNYVFSGLNTNSFTDASYAFYKKNHTIIGGLNFLYDRFKQNQNTQGINHSNETFTTGIYLQDTWDASAKVKLETGLRIDNASYSLAQSENRNEVFMLPRVSVLFKINNKISSRIGGGLGYKTPTIFTEQTETNQYQNIQPLSNVEAEKSIGFTADINYKTKLIDELQFSINQMFFYTSISNPLVLQYNLVGNAYFTNAGKAIHSKGFETNLKFIYKEDVKFFVGYTFIDAKATYVTGNQFLPLLPKNKLNLTLMYEKEDDFKIGLEGYFSDKQYLYNGTQTPSFWEFGFMAQKTVNKVSLFINFENFTDQRQSKYKTVVNPPHNNPTFDDIWNHTEGFVMNGGFKIKL